MSALPVDFFGVVNVVVSVCVRVQMYASACIVIRLRARARGDMRACVHACVKPDKLRVA